MKATVNHLPVLTWNKLKINETVISVPEPDCIESMSMVSLAGSELPCGITAEAAVPYAEAVGRYESAGIDNKPEMFVAGKVPIYNEQEFATGMGRGADDIMIAAGAVADIYTVEAGKCVDNPFYLELDVPDNSSSVYAAVIHVKEGAEATFVINVLSESESEPAGDDTPTAVLKGRSTEGFLGLSTRVYLEKNAKLKLVVVQMLDSAFTWFHDVGAYEEEKASFELTKIDLGASAVYEGLNTQQAGDDSEFAASVGYMGLKGYTADINYNDVFRGKRSKGTMRFYEALLDNARKTLRDTLDFRQYATKSVGDEEENVLMFGGDVENKSIPLILCEEEDVEGRHAATLGKLADDMLFYMQTRGLDRKKAEELMVYSYMNRLAADCDDDIKEKIRRYISCAFCGGRCGE